MNTCQTIHETGAKCRLFSDHTGPHRGWPDDGDHMSDAVWSDEEHTRAGLLVSVGD